jgi:hypothetical protein
MGSSYVREDQRKAFEHHELKELVRSEAVRVFEMRRPTGSFYSAVLSFYPSGHAVIFGDLRIGEGKGIVGVCDFGFFASPRRPTSGEARRRWDSDAGWLAACQEKFASLYAKTVKEDAGGVRFEPDPMAGLDHA